MAIYAIRHTSVQVPKSVCYGQSDVPLADNNEEEIDAVLKKLNHTTFEKVFSSPATRCTKLADAISPNYSIDKRLQELNFGEWEMKNWDDITDPYLFVWMENYIPLPCPNGESLQDMVERVRSFYEDELVNPSSGCAIITHAGVIRCLHHIIKGVALKELFDLEVRPGSITKF